LNHRNQYSHVLADGADSDSEEVSEMN